MPIGRAAARPGGAMRLAGAAFACAMLMGLAQTSHAQGGATPGGGVSIPDTTRRAATPDSTRRVAGLGQDMQTVLERADSLLQAHGGSRADMARLYLTWDAPWGVPRASSVKRPRAHDPRSADTLWLSFLPGRTSVGFIGFTAELYFRAAPGDTLGPWWHLEHGAANAGELTIECGPDETFPQRQPWPVSGAAFSKMDRTPATARLQVFYAVPYTAAQPVVPESLYTLCRVILRHHRDLPGCSQPVCVEWGNCELDYWLRDTPIANKGERFVAYASELPVCERFMPASTAPAAAPVRSATPVRQRAPARRTVAPRTRR